jgi:peptide/nickel transport system ATP-binding protein
VRCLLARDIDRSTNIERQTLEPTATPQGRSLLQLRGLSASYGRIPILHDIGLDVAAESCTAIVGESGSGKTTLARCIVGLHSSWNGTMTFDGEELGAGARIRTKESLKRIQYIFQNPYTSLNPRKTIRQIISQPLEHFFDLAATERTARIVDVLDDVSLGASFLERYPDQLSGGERQRVAIARAIVVEPELLVCDEVTSALDVSVQAVVIELLRRLQRERHLAIVFITHNLALVRSIAQTAIVLSEGRVVESGAVDQILEHPTHPYTIRLIADVPHLGAFGDGFSTVVSSH